MSRLRKLAALPPREIVVLAQMAVLAVPLAAMLRARSVFAVVALVRSWSGGAVGSRLPLGCTALPMDRAAALCGVVARAVSPSRPCLLQSLLIGWICGSRGLQPAIVVGLQPGVAGELDVHAWCETSQGPVGDPPSLTAQFAELLRY